MASGLSVAWFPIVLLGVWRVTHLLAAEDGPGDMVVRLRRAAGSGFWGALLDCFYCLSLWVAAPFSMVIGDRWLEHLVLWPALSGGAILLERLTARPSAPTAIGAEHIKEREEDDVLLRR